MNWTVDWTAIFTTVTLVSVIGYFLKRLLNKIEEKVDTFTQDINQVRVQIAGLSGEFSKSAIEIFNTICKERQSSCVKLHENRFRTLEDGDKHTCHKIEHLENERKESWTLQRRWNEKIEKRIFGNGE